MDISNMYISSDIPDSLEVIWDALYAMREDLIPEGDESYDKQWGDICFAMNRITTELGYDTSSNGDLVCVKPDREEA
tara:strand:- start:45 stop:275 length:231 start_codon:yes stop_codon:yes gene_type:complete